MGSYKSTDPRNERHTMGTEGTWICLKGKKEGLEEQSILGQTSFIPEIVASLFMSLIIGNMLKPTTNVISMTWKSAISCLPQ